MQEEVEAAATLKSYKGPWLKRGPLLLACGRCQRKLKPEAGDDVRALARLKKSLRKRSRKTGAGIELLVVQTPCLRVCPRNGVAVVTQAQSGRGACSILRSKNDIDLLLAQCVAEEEALTG
jgi:predicted metal-binding protein